MGKYLLRTAKVILLLTGLAYPGHGEGEVKERQMRFCSDTAKEALAWQKASRRNLFRLLKLDDLLEANKRGPSGAFGLPLNPDITAIKEQEKYLRYDVVIRSTKTRRMHVVLTLPRPVEGKVPAVVCIHGHGGSRHIVYQDASPYRGFARVLAESGYATISTEVGQHKVYEEGRTLMGERLWDVMRCVDYLTTREEVDCERIACAGLSLGGEMAMWLGAMDTRIKATVSSGFLTTVENMRHGHCPCWDFPGLTENFDFADVYSLIAPRSLQCQNGKLERAPGGFPVSIAEKAMAEIKESYRVFRKEHRAEFVVHPAGHVFDVPPALRLFEKILKNSEVSQPQWGEKGRDGI